LLGVQSPVAEIILEDLEIAVEPAIRLLESTLSSFVFSVSGRV